MHEAEVFMPRHRRLLLDGHAYHLLNRGNRRQTIFHKPQDYRAFLGILAEAQERFRMPLCGVCVMKNHVHIVVWPDEARAISEYMHWVFNVHVHRYHLHYNLRGLGHLYQDRYKAFPIQNERHLYTVMRYVEGNALRAGLVRRAEEWEWSSLSLRTRPEWRGIFSNGDRIELPGDWSQVVNDMLPDDDLEALRSCARKGAPYGDADWTEEVRRK
jgi:putative transposase